MLKKIWRFYYEGFRSMTVGRTLWVIVLVKLFVMFAVLKVFFFPSALKGFDTPQQKADHIREQLTAPLKQ